MRAVYATSKGRGAPSASASGRTSCIILELNPDSVAVKQGPFKSLLGSSSFPFALKIYEGAV